MTFKSKFRKLLITLLICATGTAILTAEKGEVNTVSNEASYNEVVYLSKQPTLVHVENKNYKTKNRVYKCNTKSLLFDKRRKRASNREFQA